MSCIDAEASYRALLTQIRDAYGHLVGTAEAPELAGIHSGGAWLAKRLARDLGIDRFGVINVALHRDDYAKKGLHSQASPTSLPFDVDGRRIVLLDDVLYTGRTVRAAINELYDYGRPAAIELAVLAERGGRELPIAARFVGVHAEVADDATLVLMREAQGEGENESGSENERFTFRTEPRVD